jgi:hypothetical protein
MKNVYIFICLAIFLGFISSIDCLNMTSQSEEGLQTLLPQSEEIGAWKMNLDFEEYKGDDLFFYINGGAEIYHEYGFERVIVQDYQSQDGKSASLEIYKMTSPESAFGMYTFKSAGKGEELDVGHMCKLQDYYLNFWKGQYLVTITGFDAERDTIEGLKAIAKAVDAKIQDQSSGKKPGLYACLPPQQLDAQSVKYFRGNLGLVNSYPFANTDVFRVREGIRGTYTAGYDIYILEYGDTEEREKAYRNAKEDFKREAKYPGLWIGEDRIELKDDSGILIVIQPHRTFILIVLGATSPEQATQIMEDLKNYLR